MREIEMKLDAASHLLRRPVSFELFLLVYLVCALVLQMINIYKTNFYLIDFNLVFFIVVILSRRLGWCLLQEFQSHWTKMYKSFSSPPPTPTGGRSAKTGLHNVGIKSTKVKSETTKTKDLSQMTLTHWLVVLCTVLVILWAIVRLIQHTSLFNLLFLFYPLLLYLSLFGFTLEPRPLRARYHPPKTFLHHIQFNDIKRIHEHLDIHPAGQERCKLPFIDKSLNARKTVKQSTRKGGHSMSNNTHHQSSHHNCSTGTNSSPSSGSRQKASPTDSSDLVRNISEFSSFPSTPSPSIAQYPPVDDTQLFWETSLLLSAMPHEVRREVDFLLSDLVIRLKQLLFNSLLCAYYVGFIPVQFADGHLSYDRWWCIEHGFLVWANSFVILASHFLPPSYLQVLYQCALHLGCWTRCVHNGKASTWSPDQIWVYDAVVQWNGESFRAEGLNNVAIPCESTQECFYLLFHSRLHVHTWLLVLQCISVSFQIVVLLRSIYWYQVLSMSVFLIFNYFILYKLLHNRLWLRRTIWLT